jgi:hypothetical protein
MCVCMLVCVNDGQALLAGAGNKKTEKYDGSF